MISISATFQGLDPLIEDLTRMAEFEIDTTELGPVVRQVLLDENRRLRLAGTDRNDAPLRQVTPEWFSDPRRGGKGPPLAPRGAGSRVVADHDAQVIVAAANHLFVVDFWHGDTAFIRYHQQGVHGIVRDIVGYPPSTVEYVQDVMDDYVDRRLDEGFAFRGPY